MRIIKPVVHRDSQRFFHETVRADRMEEFGIDKTWVQDNHSRFARGEILDVAIVIRGGSPTYGRWEAVTLGDGTVRHVYLPVGFAHGFLVMSEVADVVYRCSSYHDPEFERGFVWNDPDLEIAWPQVPVEVSARDADAPRLAEIADSLPIVI